MPEQDGESSGTARKIAPAQPSIACDIHSFGATAARAFEALTAVEPLPVAATIEPAEPVSRSRAGAQTPGMVKRIADRAEATANK